MKNSAITYKELLEEGLITKKENEVLALFKRSATPISGNDIDSLINGGHKRLASLERKGLIKAVDSDRDYRTGRMNTLYVIVPNPTIQSIVEAKKPTYKQLEKELAKLHEGMSAFYDDAFRRGVKSGLVYVYNGTFPEAVLDHVVNSICEDLQK